MTAQPVSSSSGGEEWKRLDIRMLLVHPVNEVLRFLPALIAVFFIGSSSDGDTWWHLAALAIPVALGLLRYATTRYRIGDERIELRRGLVRRTELTARLSRVRTVEISSSPIHRMLGLAKVDISTAHTSGDGGRVVLDSLPLARARTMRAALLHRPGSTALDGPGTTDLNGPATTGSHQADTSQDGASTGIASYPSASARQNAVPAAPQQDTVLLRFDAHWIRYAPLTATGLTVAAAILALFGRFASSLVDGVVNDATRVSFGAVPIWAVVTMAIVTALVLFSALAIVGYLLSYWGFTVTRDTAGRSFQVTRGLLTTREASIESARIRGVQFHEPLGLRSVGAASAEALVTGMDRRSGGTVPLAPPSPRAVGSAMCREVLRSDEALTTPLTVHGPRATQRRYVRALAVAIALAGGWCWLVLGLGWWPWLVPLATLVPLCALAMARDRARRLAHAVTPEFVISRAHCLRGRRTILARQGIIGWNVSQSFFQRRAGLATLTATTATGQQGYDIYDVDEAEAVAIANAATPGLLAPFLIQARDKR